LGKHFFGNHIFYRHQKAHPQTMWLKATQNFQITTNIPCCCVTDIFINVVNIWSHGRDHGSQTSSLVKERKKGITKLTVIMILKFQLTSGEFFHQGGFQ